MDNKKRIIISLAISAVITLFSGYSIFKIPDRFFPTNFKIIILIISFFSITLSIFLIFIYTNLFRQQIIDDKRRKLRKSNFLIAFVSVTIIWSILFVLSVYDSPDKIVDYLLEYGLYLPFGIIGWYVIISIIRKERYLTKRKLLNEDIIKTEPVTRENIKGIIITEGGYPAHGYDLIFTDQRLIVVDTGPTFGGLHVRKGDKKYLQYQDLGPEQILSNFNRKWSYYSNIVEVKLNKGILNSFVIKAPTFSGKYYFKKYQYQQAEDLFNKFLYLKSSSIKL